MLDMKTGFHATVCFFPIVVLLSVIATVDLRMAKDFGLSDVTGTYLDLEGFTFIPCLHAIETSCLRLRLDSSTLWKVIWITAEELRMG
ncbi:hypothetical protein QYF61_017534 [Mycteria americana]|uniref:Uncharacterized protein n=1 Tax=Mycteria americana TaxID=33587 RepID=A0AAN7NQ13_MYCAM|nr:hypothetical protein QYF61_017534 [Mycteria americana]